jgi:RNA polymerase sigma factor (sigma-70 family)
MHTIRLLNCDQFAVAIGIGRQPLQDIGPRAVPSDPTALFIEHRGSLVDYATRIVGSRAHAEDLVQEAWLRFDEVARQRLLDEPLGYLYRIVRNLALDGRRRTALEGQIVGGGANDALFAISPAVEPTPEAVALHREELRLLMAALDELPERTRIAFEMHRFGGCKLREIAEFLEISLPWAQRLVADGLLHCRRRLKRK